MKYGSWVNGAVPRRQVYYRLTCTVLHVLPQLAEDANGRESNAQSSTTIRTCAVLHVLPRLAEDADAKVHRLEGGVLLGAQEQKLRGAGPGATELGVV